MIPTGEPMASHQTQVANWLARSAWPKTGLVFRVVNLPPRSGKTSLAQNLLADARSRKLSTLYSTYNPQPSRICGEWATLAVEVGGALSGYSFDLAILDDPMGGGYYPLDRHLKMVEQTREWLRHLLTKLKPDGWLVLFESRFAKDDATGILQELLGHERVEQILMPAINGEGISFWPEHWSVDELEKTKHAVGDRQWSGLWQQDPII